MDRLSSRTRRARLAAALAVTLAAAVPALATAPPASASSAGQITVGGKCLEDPGSGTAAGTAIDLAACGSGTEQSFTFAADGTVTVLGQCLEIAGGSNATGALLQIDACSGGAGQRFRLLPDRTLYSPKSGKCLQVQGGSVADAARLGLAPCDPSQPLQQFGSPAAPAAPYSLSATAFTDGGFSGNDSPSLPFTDRNGRFYYQNSDSAYAKTGHVWEFYTGSNMSTATRAAISDAVDPANSADSNADTVWRCNHSVTGVQATTGPGYDYANYCDLIGVWVDPDTGWWYGLVHNEFSFEPFADNAHYDAIDYAVSKDQGATWAITDHAVTSPYTTVRANGQRWTMAADGSVQVGSQCVDITGGGTTAGTAVGRYSCNGQGNQKWTVTNGTLVNPASGLCLTASGTASGATFTIAACGGAATQKFTAPSAGASGQIKLTGTPTLCLDGTGTLDLAACNDLSKDGRLQFPNQTYYWGDGDPRLFVDYRSGYFYVYYMSRLVDQNGGWGAFEEHVARAPLSGKMAASSWTKWYNGSWSTPGVGGAESDIIPADGGGSGYLGSADGYSPATTGSVSSQVAAGSAPPSSQLSVLNVSWNAYLGKYIGTPENEFGSSAPQHIYASDDLATQQWTDLGPVGGTQSSWYRWLLDPANLTSSTVLGKQFSLYCNISCQNGSGGGHMEITITPTAAGSLPAAPVTAGTTYQISAGSGQYLVQNGSALTTTGTGGTAAAQLWTFTATGDGFYTIKNASSGQVLGVDPTTDAGRAWGSGVSLGTLGSSPTVGQQWSIQTIVTSPAGGGASTPTGGYRLVNRYSDLALSLTGGTAAVATSPQRSWDNTGTGGDTRSTAAQTLTFVATGGTPSLDGPHVVSIGGKALDDPNNSLNTGVQLITWAANGGSNQNWTFTRQADGSYTIVNGRSNLCADDNGGFTTPGTSVIQWTCTGGANQHWTVVRQANGAYKITNVHSSLLLTTAGGGDGALVTQQADTGSALQLWTIS